MLPTDLHDLVALLRSATPGADTLGTARAELLAEVAAPPPAGTASWIAQVAYLALVLLAVGLPPHDGLPLAPPARVPAPVLEVLLDEAPGELSSDSSDSSDSSEPAQDAVSALEPLPAEDVASAREVVALASPVASPAARVRRAAPRREPEASGKQEPPPLALPETPAESTAPSAELADGLRQYASERYADAAVALQRVVEGGTGDAPERVAQADFFLAKCLYQLGLYHASAAAFDEVTRRGPAHPYFTASLVWLAMLAERVPEPSGVIESVGRYDAGQLAELDTAGTREHYHHLQLLLGRARYRDGRLDEAIALFQRVPDGTRHALEARFHEGVSHVRRRRARPALAAFRRVIQSIDAGRTGGHEEPQRLHDLAWMSVARLYYALSMQPRLDDDRASELLTLAVAAWRRIPLSSEHWLDSFYEETWALYVAREHGRALGHVHALDSPYFRERANPEAQVVRAMIYFEHCQWDAVDQALARFHQRFDPVYAGAQQAARMAATNEDAFRMLVAVRAGRSRVPASVLPALRAGLVDRELRRHLEQVGSISREQGRLSAVAAPIVGSSLSLRLEGELAVLRAVAVDRAGELARARVHRLAEELGERMSQIDTVELELATARREELTRPNLRPMGPPDGGRIVAVQGDQLWPWDGEWWRDELPFFVQEVENRCGR